MARNLIYLWNKHISYVRPCYSVSRATSPELVDFLRHHRVPMVCHNAKDANLVNNASLTIMDRGGVDGSRPRCGSHRRIGEENIVYSVKQMDKTIRVRTGTGSGTGALVWIHTSVSKNAQDETKQMFEYVWANKHILNGIVLDIANFSNPILMPSIYSYKTALDYVFRNIIHPFQKEYNIITPAIMLDGRNIITRPDHLEELHEFSLSRCQYLWGKSPVRPKIHLLVDRLFDSVEVK